jgi:hypothetical protein
VSNTPSQERMLKHSREETEKALVAKTMMLGDKFRVHYACFSAEGTHESEHGQFDKWPEARAEQDRIFALADVRSVWIIRTNPGLKLRSQQAGFTMRRRVPGGPQT